MLVLFLLTSCSGTVTEDKSDLVAEAVALFESGKLLPALDLALEAPEYTDCQRIIAVQRDGRDAVSGIARVALIALWDAKRYIFMPANFADGGSWRRTGR